MELDMDALIAKLQRRLEELLSKFFPEDKFPYFDRSQLLTKLMLVTHQHTLEVSHLLNDWCHQLMAAPVLVPQKSGGCGHCLGVGIVPDVQSTNGHSCCPECRGSGICKQAIVTKR